MGQWSKNEIQDEGITSKKESADLFYNSSSIVQRDPEFAKTYMREKRDLLEVLKDGNQELYDRASEIVSNYFTNTPEEG